MPGINVGAWGVQEKELKGRIVQHEIPSRCYCYIFLVTIGVTMKYKLRVYCACCKKVESQCTPAAETKFSIVCYFVCLFCGACPITEWQGLPLALWSPSGCAPQLFGSLSWGQFSLALVFHLLHLGFAPELIGFFACFSMSNWWRMAAEPQCVPKDVTIQFPQLPQLGTPGVPEPHARKAASAGQEANLDRDGNTGVVVSAYQV